jgi:hypothetical protein
MIGDGALSRAALRLLLVNEAILLTALFRMRGNSFNVRAPSTPEEVPLAQFSDNRIRLPQFS